ncbi:MAG: helix-turn-helix domain-containing protein [Acidobacteriota bacterium]
MLDVSTIEDPAAATATLDPLRNRMLAELHEPASAAGLAARLDLPRQKVNYHLRELEKLGLVTVAEERRWGGLTERLMVSRASSFVISPASLGDIAADPERCDDRLSAGYLIALAARLVREVGSLVEGARKARKSLATLSIDTVIRFRSPAERAEFTAELVACVHDLASSYHDESAPNGRNHRLIVGAHPVPLHSTRPGQPVHEDEPQGDSV